MPHARFDDRWHDHKKIRRAWRREPAAVAMHAMAITHGNQHNTDGEIDREWVEERLAMLPYKPAHRHRVLELLLELRLFEVKDDETFVVHDFLDWNLSRSQRAAFAEQGKRGGHAKAVRTGPPDSQGPGPRSSQGPSQGLSQGHSQGSSPSGNGGSSTPLATPLATPTPSGNARKRAARTPVDQNQLPSMPGELHHAVHAVMPILRAVQEQRGGYEPTLRGVGLAVAAHPDKPHVQVARDVEYWLTSGNGRDADCGDVVARYRKFLSSTAPASRPSTVATVADLDQKRIAAFRSLAEGNIA